MRKILLLVSIIFVLSLSSVYAVSCGDTITSNTVLDTDLSCSGTGLIIGANNIVLDCGGHIITGTGKYPDTWPDYYGITASGVNKVTIINCMIENYFIGVLFLQSTNSIVSNSNVSFNFVGISVYNSSQILISNNIANNNVYGIYLAYNMSFNCVILNNTASFNYNNGIRIDPGVHDNLIENNQINENNQRYLGSGNAGIILWGTYNNEITENTLKGNKLQSFWNEGNDTYNTFYHNNIYDTLPYIEIGSIPNDSWYHQILLEGNYWSNYTGVDDGSGTGKHAIAGDLIGDTNIPFPSSDFDYYPYVVENGWSITPTSTTSTSTTSTTIITTTTIPEYVQQLEQRVAELENQVQNHEERVSTLEIIVNTIQTQISNILTEITNIWNKLTDHEARLIKLEQTTTTTITSTITSTSSTTTIPGKCKKTTVCNCNDKCDVGETKQTCPWDCH